MYHHINDIISVPSLDDGEKSVSSPSAITSILFAFPGRRWCPVPVSLSWMISQPTWVCLTSRGLPSLETLPLGLVVISAHLPPTLQLCTDIVQPWPWPSTALRVRLWHDLRRTDIVQPWHWPSTAYGSDCDMVWRTEKVSQGLPLSFSLSYSHSHSHSLSLSLSLSPSLSLSLSLKDVWTAISVPTQTHTYQNPFRNSDINRHTYLHTHTHTLTNTHKCTNTHTECGLSYSIMGHWPEWTQYTRIDQSDPYVRIQLGLVQA